MKCEICKRGIKDLRSILKTVGIGTKYQASMEIFICKECMKQLKGERDEKEPIVHNYYSNHTRM